MHLRPKNLRLDNLRPEDRLKDPLTFVALFVTLFAVLTGGFEIWLTLNRNSAGPHIDRAMSYVASADIRLAQIDMVLNNPLSAETTSQVQQAKQSIKTAKYSLSQAQELLSGLSSRSLRQKGAAARATKVSRSINARLSLLAAAPTLLDETSSTAVALAYASKGWQNLQDAATLTTDAEQEFAQQTQDALVASHATSTKAADAYEQAGAQFAQAARAAPKADFSGYQAYVRQRTLMTQSALLACEDWINGHYQDANTDVTAYNGFAQAAADIAGTGLQLPSDILATTYQQQTQAAQQAYNHARAEVLRADAALR